MARMNREEVFAPDEIAIVHVMNRVVRGAFLMGTDPLTGVHYDHRKLQMEALFERFAGLWGIDLLAYAILSNHFHAVLRSRPDVVATWSDTEVARRWRLICPLRKEKDGTAKEPTEAELNAIRCDPKQLAKIRSRLSDISWWMRLICQRIGTSANREDQRTGKFWEARFKAVRLLDEESLLACAAYVDLNPIRAALAQTLEESAFTSVQRRIQALAQGPRRDGFLAPIGIDEQHDPLGPHPSSGPYRCSDKGFLALRTADYLELLDWTAREVVPGKRGHTPETVPPILQRLSLDGEVWSAWVRDFGRMFYNAAGKPQTIDGCRSRVGQRRFHVPRATRRVLAACA